MVRMHDARTAEGIRRKFEALEPVLDERSRRQWAGAEAIGGWFGTGPSRGMALVFTVAGAVGLIVTIWAFNSKYYRQLSTAYAKGSDDDDNDSGAAPVTA